MKTLKRHSIVFLFVMLILPGFSQTKTIRFAIRDQYDEKPISGVVVRPNLLGDSVQSNSKGILKWKGESSFFDTICFTGKNYYPYTLSIERGMASRTWFIHLVSRSFPLDTLLKNGRFIYKDSEKDLKLVEGFVYNANLKDPLGKVAIAIDSGKIIGYTNNRGYYSFILPKTTESLLLSYPDFQSKTIATSTTKATLYPLSYSKDDVFREQYKNSITISLLELFQGGLSIRYERFLKTNHSVGLLFAGYFFNPDDTYNFHYEYNDELMFGVTGEQFEGYKLSPFYRFYPFRNATTGGFIEAKFVAGYFSFPELIYRDVKNSDIYYTVKTPTDFWSFGGGISWGNTFTKDHFVFSISEGIQILPMKVPQSYIYVADPNNSFEMEPVTGWWYFRGAGAVIDLKISIGWVF
ncbi:MAG TPA: hypothetical protein VIN10_15480 [Bacteroidales bacterium]